MYSEEALARVELAAAREKEREEVGLSLRDTRSRVKKYDRLKKRTKTKVRGRASSFKAKQSLSSLCTNWSYFQTCFRMSEAEG